MTDETSIVVLEHLRRIRASQERMELDVGEIKTRLSAVKVQIGVLSQRVDRIDERVARIVRRLDLVEVG